MGEFTVIPNEGVGITGSSIEFPRNDTYCDKTYVVTYKDEENGCECSNDVIVPGMSCQDEIRYGDPTGSFTGTVSCEGGNTTVYGNIPYSSFTAVREGCTGCNHVYSSSGISAVTTSVLISERNETDSPITRTGSDSIYVSGQGYISFNYNVTQEGGCEPPCCTGFSVTGENYISAGTTGIGTQGTCGYFAEKDCKISKGDVYDIEITRLEYTDGEDYDGSSWLSDLIFVSETGGTTGWGEDDLYEFKAYCDKNTTGRNRRAWLKAKLKCNGEIKTLTWNSEQCYNC